jgi:hypothetical protein
MHANVGMNVNGPLQFHLPGPVPNHNPQNFLHRPPGARAPPPPYARAQPPIVRDPAIIHHQHQARPRMKGRRA